MAERYSVITLGTLRENLRLAQVLRATAVRGNNLNLVATEDKRLSWLEQHIAYLEAKADEDAEWEYQIEISG